MTSRIARADALLQPTRRAIHDLIVEQPGIRVASLARQVGIDYKTAQHHVEVLLGCDLVDAVGRQGRLFARASRLGSGGRNAVLAAASPSARRILAFLAASGPADLEHVSVHLGLARSTVSEAAARLEEASLITTQRRMRRLVLAPCAPAGARCAGADAPASARA